MPFAPSATLLIVGFCALEVNEFGPVHEYVAPLEVAWRFNDPPAHNGEFVVIEGADGIG